MSHWQRCTSLKQGDLPAVWKAAEVVPVPKKTRPCSIKSYLQPIVLLPVVAKVFDSFVREWFLDSLYPTFDAIQFSGCFIIHRGHLTAHAMTCLRSEVSGYRVNCRCRDLPMCGCDTLTLSPPPKYNLTHLFSGIMC